MSGAQGFQLSFHSNEFFFCKVRVDGDEVAVCTGDHYDIAKDAAKAHGFIPEAEEGAFVVFDEHDGPKALFDMFVWDSASVV